MRQGALYLNTVAVDGREGDRYVRVEAGVRRKRLFLGALGAGNAERVQLRAGSDAEWWTIICVTLPGTTYRWHTSPEVRTAFTTAHDGRIYVSNSDTSLGAVGMDRFGATGDLSMPAAA